MAVSEVTLVLLAMNLAQGPSAIDVKKYQSLPIEQQTIVHNFIWRTEPLPFEIEEMIKREDILSLSNRAPSYETSR